MAGCGRNLRFSKTRSIFSSADAVEEFIGLRWDPLSKGVSNFSIIRHSLDEAEAARDLVCRPGTSRLRGGLGAPSQPPSDQRAQSASQHIKRYVPCGGDASRHEGLMEFIQDAGQ